MQVCKAHFSENSVQVPISQKSLKLFRGPFLKRPGNLTGPIYF